MSRRRKILLLLGVVVVAVIFISVIRHYQLHAAVNAYIAELKAKGEPMELAQVMPPPVPPEQNSADTFRQAAALIDADQSLLATNSCSGMTMVSPGKAMICSQQPDIRGYNATNTWTEVTAAVAENEKSFALLQQIIDKPDFDFQLKYDCGIVDLDFTNLNLAPLRIAAMRLETATLCDLHRADTASAVRNLRAMLALVKAARNERFVISEHNRFSITQIAMIGTWEILHSPDVTDEQLAELQRAWTSVEFIRADEDALAVERVSGEITLAKWRSSNSGLRQFFDLGRRPREIMGLPSQNETFAAKAMTTTKIFMWRFWWSYPDELRYLKGYEVLLNAARLARTNGSFQSALQYQNAQLEGLGISKLDDEFWMFYSEKADFHWIFSETVKMSDRIIRRVMCAETVREIVVTAIALKRYQLKHGNYPADLNLLVPELISAIPHDPVDGRPLRYRLNPDGTFLLYSIGENGKDDGGNPSLEKGFESSYPSWRFGRDWVWPQPATPEEIQKYYDEQAKKSK
jgi:hypothetical protein